VEGIAEQLLLSTFAKYIDQSLEDNHIAVINVGGRYFDYFLCLFNIRKPNTISKKIACLTDRDPERKEISGSNSKSTQCYPFEYNQDTIQYTYKDNATEKIIEYHDHPNIRFFSQDAVKGKTFEYDLALHNPSSSFLITDSVSNQEELKELVKAFSNASSSIQDLLGKLRNSKKNTCIKNGIEANSTWNDNDKKTAIIASRYLNSVGKGENALELSYLLEENLKQEEKQPFTTPSYIEEAIRWICQ